MYFLVSQQIGRFFFFKSKIEANLKKLLGLSEYQICLTFVRDLFVRLLITRNLYTTKTKS